MTTWKPTKPGKLIAVLATVLGLTAPAASAGSGPFCAAWRGCGSAKGGLSSPTDRWNASAAVPPMTSATGGDVMRQHLRCASPSYNFDVQNMVIAHRGKINGSWDETTRNIGGQVIRHGVARLGSGAGRRRSVRRRRDIGPATGNSFGSGSTRRAPMSARSPSCCDLKRSASRNPAVLFMSRSCSMRPPKCRAQERDDRAQDRQVGDEREHHRQRAQPSEQAQRGKIRKDGHDKPAGQHDGRQNQGWADQNGGALNACGRVCRRAFPPGACG